MTEEEWMNELISIRAIASSLVIRCDKAIKGQGGGKPPALKKKKRNGPDPVDRRNAMLMKRALLAKAQG